MAAGVGASYDRVAMLYDCLVGPLWDHTIGRPAVERTRALVRAHVRPGAHVLDVGAGCGRSAELLLAEGRPARVVGLDLSAAMLARARRRLAGRPVELAQADATCLPFPDDAFDAVASLWVLETLPNPLAAVRECLRVLRPGGVVLVAFSSLPADPPRWMVARLIERVMRPGFNGRFLPEQLQPLHACPMPCARRYEHGFTTVATFGKRCLASPALAA